VIGSLEWSREVTDRKYFVEPHIPLFAEFKKWEGKSVLEIGCGIGTDTIEFAKAGAKVTAVDLSSESIKWARRRAVLNRVEDKIQFYQADAEFLDQTVPIGSYDLIYSFGVIHHTPHPERVIKCLRRYLKPGGELRIMVYNKWSWKVLWILLRYGWDRFWRLNELVAKYSEAQTGCPVTYTYTRKSAQELLGGFKIKAMWVDHIFPYSVPEYKEYQYKRVWYFRWMPMRLFRRLETGLGWHRMIIAERRV
jgi:SAM-dependent methyltransferase